MPTAIDVSAQAFWKRPTPTLGENEPRLGSFIDGVRSMPYAAA